MFIAPATQGTSLQRSEICRVFERLMALLRSAEHFDNLSYKHLAALRQSSRLFNVCVISRL